MRVLRVIAVLTLIGVVGGGYLIRPQPLADDALDGVSGDALRGRVVFAAAGCASCHAADGGPADVLAGGKRFVSDFGTFIAPNISSDPAHGVGGWTDLELASAIMTGVGRNGAHLFPAFPYTAYAKAEPQDIADLIAYLRTLPASDRPNEPHDVGFPFNQRMAVGVWKLRYGNSDWVTPATTDTEIRGRYLVEALGHCAECHTSRDLLGGLETDRWMGGAPNPSGEGRIPNITPAALGWSEDEIAAYLKTGFTPEFDSAGGSMAAVIRNTAQLSDDDRAAIAAYLVALPSVTD